MEARSAAIVGAGIAGLATAVSLGRAGLSTRVYERAPEPRTDGGALILWTNATHALDALGLREKAVERGTVVEAVDFRDWEGRLLWRLPVAEFAQRYGSPTLYLRRSDLLEVLLGAVPAECLSCDASVRGFEQDRSGVRPLLVGAPSPSVRADLLVGSDGLHSAVRGQLFGERNPRSAHHTAWVGIAKIDPSRWPEAPGGSTILLGEGLRCCTGTLKPRPGDAAGVRSVYWYATEKVSRSLEPDDLIDRSQLAELFRDCALPISELIEHTTDPTPFWISDRWPSRRWGAGRVTLLGDSAHASTPDIGQGACQALESAVALARALSEQSDTESALREYERSRFARTALATTLSHTTAVQSMITLPGVEFVRNLAIRSIFPPITLAQFHILLGHRA